MEHDLKNENLSLINLNNTLQDFYNKEDGNIFIKKMNKLNMQFSIMSEKYIKIKNELEKINDILFMNLFKQINIYIEEIEKLNFKMKEKGNISKIDKSNLSELNKELLYNKQTIKFLQNKLNEKENNEIKLKREIESYKRQIIFYKDKLKIDLLNNSIQKNLIKSIRSSSVKKTRILTESNLVQNNIYKNITSSSLKKSKSMVNKKEKKDKINNNYINKEEPIIKRLTVKRKNYNKRYLNNENNASDYMIFTERNFINKRSKSPINIYSEKSKNKNVKFSPFIIQSNYNFNYEKENGNNINIDKIYEIIKDTNNNFDNEIEMFQSQEKEIQNLMKLINKNHCHINLKNDDD